MKNITNIFGSGALYDENDLKGKIYTYCCACMSVYSDFLSWANHQENIDKMVMYPERADNIIVLSCQVTDLAVLNDLKKLESLMDSYPNKTFYVGGCLSKRFDIPLPDNCRRLDNIRVNGQEIKYKTLVTFDRPFWTKRLNISKNDGDVPEGTLFRYMYPLRISVGCKNKCNYCTVRDTRGDYYESEIDNKLLASEFYKNKNDIVLINDSLSTHLLERWIGFSEGFSKQVSFRNVEPVVVIKSFGKILKLAKKKLLKILHCPIQSSNREVLKDMNRPVASTLIFINNIAPILKREGVYLATNIIVDYKDFPNPTGLEEVFDYISWNPYWDGNWDIDRAKERWNHYFPWNKI